MCAVQDRPTYSPVIAMCTPQGFHLLQGDVANPRSDLLWQRRLAAQHPYGRAVRLRERYISLGERKGGRPVILNQNSHANAPPIWRSGRLQQGDFSLDVPGNGFIECTDLLLCQLAAQNRARACGIRLKMHSDPVYRLIGQSGCIK